LKFLIGLDLVFQPKYIFKTQLQLKIQNLPPNAVAVVATNKLHLHQNVAITAGMQVHSKEVTWEPVAIQVLKDSELMQLAELFEQIGCTKLEDMCDLNEEDTLNIFGTKSAWQRRFDRELKKQCGKARQPASGSMASTVSKAPVVSPTVSKGPHAQHHVRDIGLPKGHKLTNGAWGGGRAKKSSAQAPLGACLIRRDGESYHIGATVHMGGFMCPDVKDVLRSHQGVLGLPRYMFMSKLCIYASCMFTCRAFTGFFFELLTLSPFVVQLRVAYVGNLKMQPLLNHDVLPQRCIHAVLGVAMSLDGKALPLRLRVNPNRCTYLGVQDNAVSTMWPD
jgi:hypothetical protein